MYIQQFHFKSYVIFNIFLQNAYLHIYCVNEKKVQNAIYWYPSSTIFIAEQFGKYTVARSHDQRNMVVHLRQMPGAQPKLFKLFFNQKEPTVSEVNFFNIYF